MCVNLVCVEQVSGLALGLWIIGGIFAFFLIEKLVRGTHGGEESDDDDSAGHGHSHGTLKAPPKKTTGTDTD